MAAPGQLTTSTGRDFPARSNIIISLKGKKLWLLYLNEKKMMMMNKKKNAKRGKHKGGDICG